MKKMNFLRKLIIPIIIAFILFPMKGLAHGSAEEHANESISIGQISMYISIGAVVLLIVFVISWIILRKRVQPLNIRKKEDRERKNKINLTLKWVKGLTFLWLLIAIVGGALSFMGKGENISFTHVHGLDFTADGKEIFVPSHDGLRVFKDGKWRVGSGDQNDYMGFAMTDDGFYSSGHPGNGSNLSNPVGIVKSTDGGKTLRTLALSGESDFHAMDVGYKTHAIYVFNMSPNSIMNSTGFYYSLDDTKSWKQSAIKGFNSEPSSIAAHPTKANVMAIGAKDGLYVSYDYGNNVKNVFPDKQVTAITYGIDGSLWAGIYKTDAALFKIDPRTEKYNEIAVPVKKDDAIAYIALNPKNDHELALATYNKDIYLSEDAGDSWVKIVDQGKGINLKQK